ncbi:MAG: VanZ family protein [Ruminococcus sp.]|nr:VanZ family protein [Ruminococcus sp.]
MKSKKLIVYVFFAVYIAAALYLLFFMRRSVWAYYSYGEYFRKNTNFVPFLTIREYIGYLRTDDAIFGDVSFVNIWGNFVALMPTGIFFPAVWKKQRSFGAFALTITAVTVSIETVQFLTMCGSCDIDDLILNVTGALLGFWLTKLKIVRRLAFTDIGFEKGE